MILIILCIVLFAWMPLPAIATPVSALPVIAQAAIPEPTQVLERLFREETIQAAWFSPQFLQQIPIAQIRALLASLKQAMGSLQTITPVADGYELMFEQGTVPSKLQLNNQGQITVLFFGPPDGPISLEDAVAAVQTFEGEASLLVLSGDEVLASVEADKPLAVGSAFKLAVLAALQQAIAQSTLDWDDVVTLQPEWRSLPSGLLQDWPVDTAITLESLATLMISVSDNTAADALIQTVGREAIETLTPQNQPFFTTREFFALKNPANAERLATFRAADIPERRQILSSLTTAALPGVDLFSGNPVALDIEWYFSAQELCELMAQVQDLPLMGVNPGIANPQAWQQIAFKGGSEPGVLNLTTGLKAADGRIYCVAATWNTPAQTLDEIALTRLYSGILSGLAKP